MNNRCDYFERLVSDAADTPLATPEQEELRDHLATCASCRKFQSSVENASAALKLLPVAEMTSPLRPALVGSPTPSLLQRIWRARISLPAPLAAAAILVVIGLAVWGATRHSVEPVTKPSQPTATITYVQVEQIAPGSGTLITAPQKP
jgi:hypothetical protein